MKVWTSVREVWGLKPILRILLSNEYFFKQTCQSEWNMQNFAKMAFWQTFCEKPVLTNFSQFFELHETNFSSWLWRTHFRSNLKKYLFESNVTCFIVTQTVEFDEHGLDSLKSMHGRWNFVKNSKNLTWVHMKDFSL